jgi:valyl-tRNA synthetase
MATSQIEGIRNGEKTTLKKLMETVVANGQIKIVPDQFEKIYFHWINNLRDWCISRQIWFGHRIPVWYCREASSFTKFMEDKTENKSGDGAEEEKLEPAKKKCGEPIVSIEDVAVCPHCGGEVEQDPDTLDTWFSSGLWTFSTLGWPDKDTPDFRIYHPTNVLETGYDILFFWVARMILMSTYLLGDIPFRTVYLHGLVRDERGRKMSKSLGNIIDPADMIETYGTDAVRMSLIVGNPPGSDLKLSREKIKAYKHFANKIWNATRFVLSACEDMGFDEAENITSEDQKRLDELRKLTEEITRDMERYRFYLAAEKLYHYFWHVFADVVIEESKTRLKSNDSTEKQSAQRTLWTILTTCLKMLHPFMPFVTEEIWSLLPNRERLLMVEKWP